MVLATTAGATAAGRFITGRQVQNGSLTGADVKDHSLTSKDFRGSLRGPQGATGPAGPQGAQGSAGPQGPAGPSGAGADIKVVRVESPPQTLQPGDTSSGLIAQCPAGTTVVGTGFNTGIGNADFVLAYGTFVGGFMDNDVSIPIDVSVQAVCATGVTNGGAATAARARSVARARARFRDDENAARAKLEDLRRSG